MFSAVSLKSLGGVLVMALLSGIWWHGYTQGAGRSTERCAATISQLREAFAMQEKQRAEQAAQTLQALQQRFTHQVKLAHQAEQHYLNRIAQLRDKTQHSGRDSTLVKYQPKSNWLLNLLFQPARFRLLRVLSLILFCFNNASATLFIRAI